MPTSPGNVQQINAFLDIPAGRALPVELDRLPGTSNISMPLNGLQYIFHAQPWTPGHNFLPNLIFRPLRLRQHLPMRTLLRLQPLKVVDLIPAILQAFNIVNQIIRRQRREPYALAVLDNRPARTVQIHIRILALVHTELPARGYDDAVDDVGDVCGA
jgi:hypothetical protein